MRTNKVFGEIQCRVLNFVTKFKIELNRHGRGVWGRSPYRVVGYVTVGRQWQCSFMRRIHRRRNLMYIQPLTSKFIISGRSLPADWTPEETQTELLYTDRITDDTSQTTYDQERGINPERSDRKKEQRNLQPKRKTEGCRSGTKIQVSRTKWKDPLTLGHGKKSDLTEVSSLCTKQVKTQCLSSYGVSIRYGLTNNILWTVFGEPGRKTGFIWILTQVSQRIRWSTGKNLHDTRTSSVYQNRNISYVWQQHNLPMTDFVHKTSQN